MKSIHSAAIALLFVPALLSAKPPETPHSKPAPPVTRAAPLDFLGIQLGKQVSIAECPSQLFPDNRRMYLGMHSDPCFKHSGRDRIGTPLDVGEELLIEAAHVDGIVVIRGERVDGKLEGLVIETSGVKDQDALYASLVEKYGTPSTIEHSKLQNRMGASFDRVLALWLFNNLTVTFISPGSTIDFGLLTVQTVAGKAFNDAKSAKAENARPKL